jgi:hypothetical protein
MELDDIARQLSTMRTESQEFRHQVLNKLDNLNRGVYGDDQNGQAGLMQRQKADEVWRGDIDNRIEKVERKQWKFNATIGLITVGLGAVWEFIKGIKS